MNIFGGRPGIAAGVLAVIAILAAAFLKLSLNLILISAAFLLVAVCTVMLSFGIVKPYRFFSIAVVFLVFITSWARGIDLFYRASPEAEALCGENAYVHATVAERYASGDYYAYFIIRLKSVNGIPYDGKALLECEYNSDLQVGYEFVLRSADVEYTMILAENEAASRLADEIFLEITSFSEADCHILSEDDFTLSDRLDRLNAYLCAKLKNLVGGDAGRLAAAMLLGDRASLTSEMYRDYRRAGISHYLAVSGLHVSIITGLVSLLLVNLRIKRGSRNILLISFALGYLLLLGFPVSAVRSVTMLTIVFIAYSMGDHSDPVNSLGIAAAMIIVASPSAVFDQSFILSFCATLGIVAFMPAFSSLLSKLSQVKKKENGKEEKKRKGFGKYILKILWAILTTVMTTLCAVSATLLPSAYFIGETSSCALISNLLLAPVGAPMLASSLLCLVFGEIPYLGNALEFVIKECAEYMLDVAARFSDIRGVLIPLVSDEAFAIVVAFTVILAASMIIKIKRKELLLIVPAVYPLVLAIISAVAIAALSAAAELTCIGIGEGESILLQEHEESVIVDISDGSYTRLRLIADLAQENGVTEFDTVMLTHYHNRHVSSLSRFAAEEKVRLVLLPYPTTEDEAWIMVQLADALQNAGCSVRILEPEGEVKITDGITLTYPRITRIDRSAQPVAYLSFSYGEERVTYLSASSWENGLYFADELNDLASESNAVLIGSHGPVNKEIFDISLEKAESVYVFGEELTCLVHPESSLPKDRTTVNAVIAEFDFGEGK